MKRPRHRIFDYTPQFYKPDEDQKEKRKKKLGFKRQLVSSRKKKNPFLWLVFVLLVIYVYLKITGVY